MSKVFRNKAIVSPSYDGHANGVNLVALNEDGDTGQSVPYPTTGATYITYLPQSTQAHTTISTPADPYSVSVSHANAFTTDVPVTDADRVSLDANPNLVFELVKGSTITGLSFAAGNVKSLWLGNEGPNGGDFLQDLTSDLGTDTIDAIAPTMTNTTGGATVTFSSNTSNDFDLAVTAVGTSQNNPAVKTNSVDTGDGKKYILSFDLVVNSGTCIFNTVYAYLTQPYGWSVNTELITGSHLFIVDVSGTNDHAQMYFDGTNLFNISVTNWEIRELTASEIAAYTANCRSYYQNLSDNGFNNLLAEQDATGRAVAVREAYTANLKNPQGKNVSIGVKPNLDNYSMLEVVSGELQDFGGEEAINGGFDTDTDWTKQSNWTIADGLAKALISTTGQIYQGITTIGKTYLCRFEITGYTSGSVQAQCGSGQGDMYSTVGFHESVITALASTNFGINASAFIGSIDNISVKELIGTSQREEFRFLTHELGVADILRTNHILQPTPALPDADTFITLDGTAKIGYPDTIDATHANIKMWTSIKTEAEQLAFINDVIYATRDVLTDENDEPLTDENGMYMYT